MDPVRTLAEHETIDGALCVISFPGRLGQLDFRKIMSCGFSMQDFVSFLCRLNHRDHELKSFPLNRIN